MVKAGFVSAGRTRPPGFADTRQTAIPLPPSPANYDTGLLRAGRRGPERATPTCANCAAWRCR